MNEEDFANVPAAEKARNKQLIDAASNMLRAIAEIPTLGPSQGLSVVRAISELSNASLDDDL